MFVLEDRGFIHDADATGEHDPFGRVSLHVDTGQRRHCRPKIAEDGGSGGLTAEKTEMAEKYFSVLSATSVVSIPGCLHEPPLSPPSRNMSRRELV